MELTTKELSFIVRDAYGTLESPTLIGRDAPGEKVALTGNGALARGILEAGTQIVTFYSGAPVNTVADNLSFIADKFGFYVEASTNEKVAVEVAAGASMAGLRSAVLMKDLGLHLALDTLLPLVFSGIKGGMVIISGDDPGALTSPAEMDSREFAQYLHIMGFDPANAQEAKDMVIKAFDISEELELPVLMRLTAQVCYGRGAVTLGKISKGERKAVFEKNLFRWFIFSEIGMGRKNWLHNQQPKLQEIARNISFNQLEIGQGAKAGIIASGGAYNYVKEALRHFGNEEIALLKLGVFHPIPKELIEPLIEKVDRILVIEELEPIIEKSLLEILGRLGKKIEVKGKLTGDLPEIGNYTPDMISDAIGNFLGREKKAIALGKEDVRKKIQETIPPQFPAFCAGCPHMATFYTLNQAIKKVGGEVIVTGDIGCYGLGALPPLATLDNMLSMGASIGIACGFSKAKVGAKIVACIGDSTILHAGLPPLINATYNRSDFLIVVLDNQMIAATGHQPTPGIGITEQGESTRAISIEELVKACGVDEIKIIDPGEVEDAIKAFSDALRMSGMRVIISRRACTLVPKKEARGKGEELIPYHVDEFECSGCRICATDIGCPAISFREKEGQAWIDEYLCRGCGVCSQVCPTGSIRRAE